MVRADAAAEIHAPLAHRSNGIAVTGGRVVVAHVESAATDSVELHRQLADDHHSVRTVVINRSLVTTIRRLEADLVVLIHTPELVDLARLCRQLSARTQVRIIVVADPPGDRADIDHALDEVAISVLDAGADDFIWTPVSDRILRARVRAALRSRPVTERRPSEIVVGDTVIDCESHVVALAGCVTNFPRLQFGLLLILANQPGVVVSREQLISEMWGASAAAFNPRRLRVAVSHLRKLLGTGPRRPLIERVAHAGYCLTVPA